MVLNFIFLVARLNLKTTGGATKVNDSTLLGEYHSITKQQNKQHCISQQ